MFNLVSILIICLFFSVLILLISSKENISNNYIQTNILEQSILLEEKNYFTINNKENNFLYILNKNSKFVFSMFSTSFWVENMENIQKKGLNYLNKSSTQLFKKVGILLSLILY